MFELQIAVYDQDETTVKCTPCDKITEHQWTKVIPWTIELEDKPLEQLQLIRRIIMCTECGNLGLKK